MFVSYCSVKGITFVCESLPKNRSLKIRTFICCDMIVIQPFDHELIHVSVTCNFCLKRIPECERCAF